MPQAWLHSSPGDRPVPAEAHFLSPWSIVRPSSHHFTRTQQLISNRHALFDEYTRRQFSAKFPNKKNPFGKAEVAARFADFDLMEKVSLHHVHPHCVTTSDIISSTQLRVLWLMTQMVMMKPEHIRPNMDEQKNDEQTAWVC